MKLWLIKFGKAWSAIRSEGLVRGGGRVLRSFFALFRRVGSGDILFLTGGLGDSARYRTWHVAEELRRHGFVCSTTTQDNPFITRYANRFRVFVFHRVMYTPSIATLIAHIKEQGKVVIFETDDLVFDAEYLKHMDYFRRANTFERKQYEGGVGAEILADPYVEVCTTSTDFLADKLRERGKRVFVVPNRLSEEDVAIMDTILQQERNHDHAGDDSVVIGYFSGAKGHDKDFATVSDVLLEILARYPEVRLFIAGPLELDARYATYGERVTRLPYVPRAEHFANVAHVDINIAPLEVGNPFCESKSELKFFEAGYLGVPTVAAGTDPFRRAIEQGVDGFIATTPDEWREILERLIGDRSLRERIGREAHARAAELYTVAGARNDEYYAYLQSKVSK